MRETVLPFKVEMTRDMITPHAGLALVGEFAVGLGVLKSVDRHLPKPGSGAGYGAHEYVFPMVLMLSGGGRKLVMRGYGRFCLWRGFHHRMLLEIGFGGWDRRTVLMVLRR